MFSDVPAVTDNSAMSEYERNINKNIMSIREQFEDLVESTTKNFASQTANAKRKREHENLQSIPLAAPERPSTPSVKYIRRSARNLNSNKKTVSYNENDESDDDDNQKRFPKGLLRIKFPWFKENKNKDRDEQYYNSLAGSYFIDGSEDESDEDNKPKSKRKRHNKRVTAARLAVAQVTDEMLENISYSSSKKVYCSNDKGTTCHQCRQKTLDQKSYCRYKDCRGVRGMFCGFCLGKRYGEDVAEALKNPRWVCPPCRGYCNCSICRRKEGKQPTGQVAQFASSRGFKSVRHMLSNTEGETENIIASEFVNEDKVVIESEQADEMPIEYIEDEIKNETDDGLAGDNSSSSSVF